jgi:propionyl-CoA synthetase
MGSYKEIYQQWLNDPEGFWAEVAEDIHWYKKWDKVLDDSEQPIYRWYSGGEVNTCYNAVDRHVENGRADQLALIYDSPVTDTVKTFTYQELQDQVARFAGVLAAQGVSKGDRVIIYMPMVPEAAIAMLACARIGTWILDGKSCCNHKNFWKSLMFRRFHQHSCNPWRNRKLCDFSSGGSQFF